MQSRSLFVKFTENWDVEGDAAAESIEERLEGDRLKRQRSLTASLKTRSLKSWRIESPISTVKAPLCGEDKERNTTTSCSNLQHRRKLRYWTSKYTSSSTLQKSDATTYVPLLSCQASTCLTSFLGLKSNMRLWQYLHLHCMSWRIGWISDRAWTAWIPVLA